MKTKRNRIGLLLLFGVFVFMILTACENQKKKVSKQNDEKAASSVSEASVNYLDGEEKAVSDRKIPDDVIKYAKKQYTEILKVCYTSLDISEFPDFNKNKFSLKDFSLGKGFRIKDDTGEDTYIFPVRWKGVLADFYVLSKSSDGFTDQYSGYFNNVETIREIDKKGMLDDAIFVTKNKTWYAKTSEGLVKISEDINY